MLTVIIRNNGEPNVIELTYENLYRELKDITDSELKVADHWLDVDLSKIKNRYICFVEADCLVQSGYFASQMGLFNKSPMSKRLAMLSSATGINNWADKIYGYSVGNNYSNGVIPNRDKKSRAVYPVQIGYVPGAVIRKTMLQKALADNEATNGWEKDLIYLSAKLSMAFWRQGSQGGPKHIHGQMGNWVHVNPNSTYVTTEEYVNDIGHFDPEASDLVDMFKRESI